jgi:hypothetical protein
VTLLRIIEKKKLELATNPGRRPGFVQAQASIELREIVRAAK